MNIIPHITFNTGHTRMSPRHEVADATIEILTPILRSGGGNIPNLPLWTLDFHESAEGWHFNINHDSIPMVVCMVARPGADSAKAWAQIERVYFDFSEKYPEFAPEGLNAAPECPEQSPWLAVIILPSMAVLPSSLVSMLGDFERCIAWTFLERFHK